MSIILSAKERQFVAQSKEFQNKLFERYKNSQTLQIVSTRVEAFCARPIAPVLIENYLALTTAEITSLREQLYSPLGVTAFIAINAPSAQLHVHPLLTIAAQLSATCGPYFPVTQDEETHRDVIARFGFFDGTTKIYRKKSSGGAMSGEDFEAHQDGMGNGGNIAVGGLYMDSPPLHGGYTYFVNLALLSMHLATNDPDAFESLFLPDALTVERTTGAKALRTTGPVLYISDDESPCVFLRKTDHEYRISWRSDYPPLTRAAAFIDAHTRPFSYGSNFVHMTARGHGCFWDNRILVHGRTGYSLEQFGPSDRVLSRKWWVTSQTHQALQHYPSLSVARRYADLFPELFGRDKLEGKWILDGTSNQNVRLQ